MTRLINKLFKKFGYVDKENIKIKLLVIMSDIEDEINSRPQYPNIGKKGCLRRLSDFYISELK